MDTVDDASREIRKLNAEGACRVGFSAQPYCADKTIVPELCQVRKASGRCDPHEGVVEDCAELCVAVAQEKHLFIELREMTINEKERWSK